MELKFADYCSIVVLIISVISLCMSYYTGYEIDKIVRKNRDMKKKHKD